MTPWSALYPLIEPFVIGCPLALIDQQLFNVGREFCDKTLAARARYTLAYRVGAGSIVAGSDALAFSDLVLAPGDAVVVRGAGAGGRNLAASVLSVLAGVATLDRRAEASVSAALVSAPSYVLPLAVGEKLHEIDHVLPMSGGRPLIALPEDELNDRRPEWRDELAPDPEAWTFDYFRRLYLYRAPTTIGGGVRVEAVLTLANGAQGLPGELADEWGHAIAAGVLARLLSSPGVGWADPGAAQIQQSLYLEAVSDARSRARRQRMRGITTVAPVSFGGVR